MPTPTTEEIQGMIDKLGCPPANVCNPWPPQMLTGTDGFEINVKQWPSVDAHLAHPDAVMTIRVKFDWTQHNEVIELVPVVSAWNTDSSQSSEIVVDALAGVDVVPVPEPGIIPAILSGAILLCLLVRRRRTTRSCRLGRTVSSR